MMVKTWKTMIGVMETKLTMNQSWVKMNQKNGGQKVLRKLLESYLNLWNCMMHTFTAGDDPQSNCHGEAQVNQLKRRTRSYQAVAPHGRSRQHTLAPGHAICHGGTTKATDGAPWFPCSKNAALQVPGFGQKKDGMIEGICWVNLLLKHACCVPALTSLQVGLSEWLRTNICCMLVRPFCPIHWAIKLSCNLRQMCGLANLTCVFGTSSHLQDQHRWNCRHCRDWIAGRCPLWFWNFNLKKSRKTSPKMKLFLKLMVKKGIKGMKCWGSLMKLTQKTWGRHRGLSKGWMLMLCPGEIVNHKTPKKLALGQNRGLLPNWNLWIVWKTVWVGCIKTFPVHCKICWMLFPLQSLLEKFVGLIFNGFKGKKNGWRMILSWSMMAKINGLSNCVAFKLMMSWPRIRGRFCKPPQSLWMKSEMNVGNGKMRWWKNTTVWSMKQRPLNLLTFPCWIKKRLSLSLENLWLFEKQVLMGETRNVEQWSVETAKWLGSCSGQSLHFRRLWHSDQSYIELHWLTPCRRVGALALPIFA